MTGSVTFSDESKEHSVRRKAEYDDKNLHDLVLTLDKRGGGQMTIPLLKNARSNIEREDHQENTLLRIKPLAEIESALPVSTGYGAPIYQGKAVAMLRPGYLYIFRRDRLWRELEIGPDSKVSDVDLSATRKAIESPESNLRIARPAEGEWLDDVLVPVFLQGKAIMHDIRMAYSEVQWDWGYIQKLEADEKARNVRTTGVGHAWAVTKVEGLSFQTGFPASRAEDLPELRARDLGVELMLESPRDFNPEFQKPSDSELCAKLAARLREAQEESEDPIDLDIRCDADEDQLAELRGQKGLACVALPDPLFKLRHSLAQLQLALHYLDAVDVSIQKNPMVHSAMLIRQAVLDPQAGGKASSLSKYAEAIDRQKLDEVLDASEKNHAIRIIEQHVEGLTDIMKVGGLDPFFDDYRTCSDHAICEAYLLIADKLNVMQQIPGVLKAQGVSGQSHVLSGLKKWILDGSFLSKWAPQRKTNGSNFEGSGTPSPFERMQTLAEKPAEIDENMLNRLNTQSLVYLEKQLKEKAEGNGSAIKDISNAGKVGGLVSGALAEWSSAILAVCKRLIEEGDIQQIEIQKIMQAVSSNLVLTDPELKGVKVMDRAGAVKSGSIIGVRGNGLDRGLNDFDYTEGVLTRKKDYLYADLLGSSDEIIASSSPTRAADAVEEAVHKVAGGTMVFFAPDAHPEAQKLGLLKVDFAKRVGKVVDGPAVSRGLVVLAAFNFFVELNNLNRAAKARNGNVPLGIARSFGGAAAELIAASLKLSVVLGNRAARKTEVYKFATRPLFDMKNWVFIGDRLKRINASTLVRTASLASFAAGAVNVVVSSWEMRISLSNRDFDAATGHAIALAGGLIFLAQPLIGPLLAIPGWGWALLGMSMVVGGSFYAGAATDDSFEQLLKRGPWGAYPDDLLVKQDDQAYYSQLLSLLSPIEMTAQKYADIEPDPALSHPSYLPEPDDYVITVQFPLVSRLNLYRGHECSADLPVQPFNLVVQEIAYQSSNTSVVAPGSIAPVSSTQLVKTTPLTKVIARQSLPHLSAVRFLVKRELQDSDYRSLLYQESVTTRVRVGLQATLDTELGPLVFPAPVYEDYEIYSAARHSTPPPKERTILDPYSQSKSPYWFFAEVSA
ncbi:MAG: toxin VasX [Marinobacter sp.]